MSVPHAVRQEDDRIRGVLVFAIFAGVMLFITFCVFINWILWRGFERSFHPGGLPEVKAPKVMPAVIGGVNQTLINFDTTSQQLTTTKLHQLEQHGWIDQAAGVAKIPIQEAMRARVREGGR